MKFTVKDMEVTHNEWPRFVAQVCDSEAEMHHVAQDVRPMAGAVGVTGRRYLAVKEWIDAPDDDPSAIAHIARLALDFWKEETGQ